MQTGTTAAVLRAVGVPEGAVVSCEPLTGGTYNTVTRVTLRDGRDWVVKIPPLHATGMSYEQRLLVNEVAFYEAATAVGGGRIPQVVHSELDSGAPAGAYVVMTACPGRPWNDLAEDLLDGEEQRLRTELGRIVGRLHTVRGPAGFGYPAESLGPLSPTWREAFTGMAGAVLADAEKYGARLPRPVAEIRAVLDAATPVLDEVTVPALVHFDLWQGNVLVTGEPGARSIGGVIDGERMFWGDPVADFVSTALLGDLEEDKDFLAGYASVTGGPVEFTASVRLRIALYRSYLYLIMLTETVPREAPEDALEWTWREVAPRLVAALEAVESAPRSRE
ncbi:aminoglycoside phosphotransferase family protein [Streptomyces sp. NBC_00683]|uniref:phosphotransferase family protein n=1 Tax=Streptomyces sp. NBC_00683 TaxID=2903670 RepID=UPI002E33C247|nr:aminoglycoside phosphotransferase family protein [Streptomyces sp. NBC_00683]